MNHKDTAEQNEITRRGFCNRMLFTEWRVPRLQSEMRTSGLLG
jgi:hypothetical protein